MAPKKGSPNYEKWKQNLSKSHKESEASKEQMRKLNENKVGKHPSEETRQKMSLSHKGKHTDPKSEEHKEKLRLAAIKRMSDPDARKRISDAIRDKFENDPIYRAKMDAAYELRKGIPRSEESKRKQSESSKGRKNTPEHNKHISDGKKGKKRAPFSEEWKRKLGDATRNKKRPPFPKEWCENMSIAKKNDPKAIERVKKLAEAKIGVPLTEEHKKKLSITFTGLRVGENHPMFGKHHTEEARNKISQHFKENGHPWTGKHHTEETCEKIRQLAIERGYEGPKNPNWNGGASKKPYPWRFNKNWKASVRSNFNFTCQECGVTEEELKNEEFKVNRTLRVHHIDFNKDNCDMRNLIPLCSWCHSKLNNKKTRQYFIDKYTAIINERYGVDILSLFQQPVTNP